MNYASNVEACRKRNGEKWFNKLPERKYFDKILKRNRDHHELQESDYDEEEYRKKYERFKKIAEHKV